MKAVYFMEKNGVKHYKCDTFWSMSTNQKNAKIHDDSIYDQNRFFDVITYRLNKVNEELDLEKAKEIINFYNGSIYGLQTFEDDALSNQFSLKEDYKLSDPIYLKIITITDDGFDVTDYKQILREEKINIIMK